PHCFPAFLFVSFSAAKLDPRLSLRLFPAHSAAFQILRAPLNMTAQFLLQLPLYSLPGKNR
ncbi:MAG: hypothetical protein WA798_19125, partial [Candidatus Acidiferrum sp.]